MGLLKSPTRPEKWKSQGARGPGLMMLVRTAVAGLAAEHWRCPIHHAPAACRPQMDPSRTIWLEWRKLAAPFANAPAKNNATMLTASPSGLQQPAANAVPSTSLAGSDAAGAVKISRPSAMKIAMLARTWCTSNGNQDRQAIEGERSVWLFERFSVSD